MDFRCPESDWSILAVAPPYSQLAGVLAGFVFTGIVLLLTQRSLNSLRVRTLTLFVAAFLVLSLDSYQWGLMAGDSVDTKACNRLLVEGEIASGLLAVGAMAIISGINWLLASHLKSHPSATEQNESEPDLGERQRVIWQLEVLCRVTLYSLATIVAIQLAVTASDYLRIVLNDGSQLAWMRWAVLSYPLFIVASIGFLEVRHRRSGKRGADRILAMWLGALGAVIYAAAATILLGAIIGVSADFWVKTPLWMVSIALAFGVIWP